MVDWKKYLGYLGPSIRHLEKERERDKEFQRKIKDFLANETKDADWKTTYLLDNIQKISVQAIRQFNKQYIYLLTIWLASYLISQGFISEGKIFSLKTVNLSGLLFFAPPFFGFTTYRLCICHISLQNTRKLHREIFSFIFPEGSKFGLLNFLEPKTALDYEFSSIMQSGIDWNTQSMEVMIKKVFLPFIFTALGLILLPLVAFIHICIITSCSIRWYSSVLSILIWGRVPLSWSAGLLHYVQPSRK